jgi:CheY-like chemotaxis protein
MVVEDEVLVRMAMAEALRRLGIVAIEARNADEALEIIHAGLVPDLLLTDIRMPGMFDGLHLAAFFEAMFPGVPVFITSAVIAPEDLKLRLNFLPKPIEPNRLAQMVANALGDTHQ